MKDWIEKKLKENSAFPLREEDIERRLVHGI